MSTMWNLVLLCYVLLYYVQGVSCYTYLCSVPTRCLFSLDNDLVDVCSVYVSTCVYVLAQVSNRLTSFVNQCFFVYLYVLVIVHYCRYSLVGLNSSLGSVVCMP